MTDAEKLAAIRKLLASRYLPDAAYIEIIGDLLDIIDAKGDR